MPVRMFSKTASGSETERLRRQFNWLRDHAHLPHLPRVISFRSRSGRAVLKMEKYEECVSFYDWIHSEPNQGLVEARFLEILEFLHLQLHSIPLGRHTEEDSARYFREKVLSKIEDAARLSPVISDLLRPAAIYVNGKPYRNFF